MKPKFFKVNFIFLKRFFRNKFLEKELWVGFYKKGFLKKKMNMENQINKAFSFFGLVGRKKKKKKKTKKKYLTPQKDPEHGGGAKKKKKKRKT